MELKGWDAIVVLEILCGTLGYSVSTLVGVGLGRGLMSICNYIVMEKSIFELGIKEIRLGSNVFHGVKS